MLSALLLCLLLIIHLLSVSGVAHAPVSRLLLHHLELVIPLLLLCKLLLRSHLVLLLLAAIWLPIGLASMLIPADGSPIFWVPWLLIASIGPLFFVVAAQAPLMQRWFGLAGNTGEPYALYAASNIGSFSGLIAYPLLVEPYMAVGAQRWLWSGLYALLFVLVLLCGVQIWRSRAGAHEPQAQSSSAPRVSWRQRMYWIALSAVPSGLMLSTTAHLTTDLMAMPLLWVIPLGLYLLSFSVAFATKRYLAHLIIRSRDHRRYSAG